MRKVTQEIARAFLNGETRIVGNSMTDGEKLFLHGNLIACKRMAGQTKDGLYITNAGWPSNTTKERLNGLPGVSIYQKKGVWYLNGNEWDGSFAKIA